MKYYKETIKLLKKNPEGLTIQEIADKLNANRNTVSIALAKLIGEQKIDIRAVGQAKLNYWKEK